MPRDALLGILCVDNEVYLPDLDQERAARALAERGIVSICERTYVRCVSQNDDDYCDVPQKSCTGVIWLEDEQEEGEPIFCPFCDREVMSLEGKERRQVLVLTPSTLAIDAFIQKRLAATGRPFRQHPRGVYRLDGDAGEVHIFYVDQADESLVYRPHSEPTVMLVANDAVYFHRLPPKLPKFRIADLVLDSSEPFDQALWTAIGSCPSELTPYEVYERISQAPNAVRMPPRSPLGVEPETDWSDCTIFPLNDGVIGIIAPGIPLAANKFDATALGMATKRSRKQTLSFNRLIEICRARGRLDQKMTGSRPDAVRLQFKELGAEMCALFGIEGSPFEDYRKDEPIVARFRALSESPREQSYIDLKRELDALKNRQGG